MSEHRNRTLLDMVRSMMSLADLPLSFCGYELETAAFTLNRTSSKSIKTTPYELWFGTPPQLDHIKIFGCKAYTLIFKAMHDKKFSEVASEGILIGFSKLNFKYEILNTKTNKITTTYDVVSNEQVFPFKNSNCQP